MLNRQKIEIFCRQTPNERRAVYVLAQALEAFGARDGLHFVNQVWPDVELYELKNAHAFVWAKDFMGSLPITVRAGIARKLMEGGFISPADFGLTEA